MVHRAFIGGDTGLGDHPADAEYPPAEGA